MEWSGVGFGLFGGKSETETIKKSKLKLIDPTSFSAAKAAFEEIREGMPLPCFVLLSCSQLNFQKKK